MAVPSGTGPSYPSGYTPRPQIRFDAIGEAWRLFQQQMSTWIVATIVAGIGIAIVGVVMYVLMGAMFFGAAATRGGAAAGFSIMGFFIGILMFAVYFAAIMVFGGGLFRMAIKQVRGEAIAVGDIFTVTDVLPNLLVAAILTGLATAIASLFCVIPGFVVGGLLMLTIPLVVDRRMAAMDAMKASWDALKGDVVMATVFYLVVSIIAQLGAIACYVGLLFTLPLMPLSIAIVYRDFFLAPTAATTGAYDAPGTVPPPPPASTTDVPPPPPA